MVFMLTIATPLVWLEEEFCGHEIAWMSSLLYVHVQSKKRSELFYQE